MFFRKKASSAIEPKRLDPSAFPYHCIHQEELEKKFGVDQLKNDLAANRSNNNLTYFLCFTNRSGSNLLARALKQTNSLGNPREYFNSPFVFKECEENCLSTFGEYLDYIYEKFSSPNKVFGAKLGSHQLCYFSHLGMLKTAFPEPKFIFMTRKDDLGQAISHYIADKTKKWTSRTKVEAVITPEYDGQAIIDLIYIIRKSNELFEKFFDFHKTKPIKVTYEHLETSISDEVKRIANELNIEVPTLPTMGDINIKKQRGDLNEEFRERILNEYDLNTLKKT